MELKKTGKTIEGQDGAIWNNLMFRFAHNGCCSVYDLNQNEANCEEIASFVLDKVEKIMPHSNSVVFGNEYYEKNDEFPILYSNVYNNYASKEEKRKGVCCAYRLQRENKVFKTTLLQVIEVGFVDDENLWCSPKGADVRPYGNFVIDPQKSIYYAFTMRDSEKSTRYFSFNLPKCNDGEYDETIGAKRVILQKDDILDFFDCDYHHFIQGACFYKGKIYSLEGFNKDLKNPPAIRVINPETKKQELYERFDSYNISSEPELIDFCNGVCYYVDNPGNMYIINDL